MSDEQNMMGLMDDPGLMTLSPWNTPGDVSAQNELGVAPGAARPDHRHRGVASIQVGEGFLRGNVEFLGDTDLDITANVETGEITWSLPSTFTGDYHFSGEITFDNICALKMRADTIAPCTDSPDSDIFVESGLAIQGILSVDRIQAASDSPAGDLVLDTPTTVNGVLTVSGAQLILDFTSSVGGGILWVETATTNALLVPHWTQDQLVWGLGAGVGRQLILGNVNFALADFGHAVQTNPTFFVHSDVNPGADNTQWWSITHDQTNAVYSVGTGSHAFVGAVTMDNNLTLSAGNIDIPITTSAEGQITQVGNRIFHTFGGADSNLFVGYLAGNFTMSGAIANTGVGAFALDSLTDGGANTAVGYGAAQSLTEGISNTIVGFEVMELATTVINCVAMGNLALAALTTGDNHTAVGTFAGHAVTTVSGGISLGYSAGRYETAGDALFIDSIDRSTEAEARVESPIYGVINAITSSQLLRFNAAVESRHTLTILDGNLDIPTTSATIGQITQNGGTRILHTFGTSCLFAGETAGNFTLSGIENVGLGKQSLIVVTTGGGNTAVGAFAGNSLTGGLNNVFVGRGAGLLRAGVSNSVLIGHSAGRGASSSGLDTVIGTGALFSTSYSGGSTVAVGYQVLIAATSAIANCVVGTQAMFTNTTGDDNTALGTAAGFTNSTGSASIYLGHDSGFFETVGAKLFIDNDRRADEADGRVKAIIYGEMAATVDAQMLRFNAAVEMLAGQTVDVIAKTGAYTATAGDYVILCDASGGAFTITLPAAASHSGRMYYIKKTDSTANKITIDGNGGETIDGDATPTIDAQYEAWAIVSDGSNWHVL